MKRKPTIVVVLFDQKSNKPTVTESAKLKQMSAVPYTASDIIRYCTRLDLLPSPNKPPVDLPTYITRGGEVGAVAFCNFNTRDLAGMSRELEHDAKMALPSVRRPWIHGCISIDISPAEYERNPEYLLEAGHSLMKMFGVDQNRYMLAVHLDSENIHVHFLYSRVDAEGKLRERNRKMPKFMAEEGTALLARQFDFLLAPHHLSRATPEGILDLASGCIVRDLDFVEQMEGMKSRNAARKKTKNNDVLTLALVARHLASDLDEFRAFLAPHGITYEKAGSGAVFIDSDGKEIKASALDARRWFTPNNLLNGALLNNFPATPIDLSRGAELVRADARLAQDIKTHYKSELHDDTDAKMACKIEADANMACDTDTDKNMASTTSSPRTHSLPTKAAFVSAEQSEIDRFFAYRPETETAYDKQEKRWEAAAKATIKSRPGRPDKDPILPGWPSPAKFYGCVGSHEVTHPRVKFADPYIMRERPSQTEVWRNDELVASIRYSRMAIISNKEEDLREALRAAHAAWGTVEIFGRPKFKKQMAKLAAEMNIPISNPELQKGIAETIKATAKPLNLQSSAKASAPCASRAVDSASRNATVNDKPKASDREMPIHPTGEPAKLPKVSTPAPNGMILPSTEPLEHIALKPVEPDNGGKQPVRRSSLLSSIVEYDWAVCKDLDRPGRFTFYPKDLIAFKIEPEDISGQDCQKQLAVNYKRQQEELKALADAVRNGDIQLRVTKDVLGRESVQLETTHGSPLNQIYRRCMFHPEFEMMIREANQQASNAKQNAARLQNKPAMQTDNIVQPVPYEDGAIVPSPLANVAATIGSTTLSQTAATILCVLGPIVPEPVKIEEPPVHCTQRTFADAGVTRIETAPDKGDGSFPLNTSAIGNRSKWESQRQETWIQQTDPEDVFRGFDPKRATSDRERMKLPDPGSSIYLGNNKVGALAEETDQKKQQSDAEAETVASATAPNENFSNASTPQDIAPRKVDPQVEAAKAAAAFARSR